MKKLSISEAAQWGGCAIYALEVHRILEADYFLVSICELGFISHVVAVKDFQVYDSYGTQEEYDYTEIQLQEYHDVYEITYQQLFEMLIEADWREEGWISMSLYTQEEIHQHIRSLTLNS